MKALKIAYTVQLESMKKLQNKTLLLDINITSSDITEKLHLFMNMVIKLFLRVTLIKPLEVRRIIYITYVNSLYI